MRGYAMQHAMLCAMSREGICYAVCYAKICYAPMLCEGEYAMCVRHACESCFVIREIANSPEFPRII